MAESGIGWSSIQFLDALMINILGIQFPEGCKMILCRTGFAVVWEMYPKVGPALFEPHMG